jgi:hypothetical protein
MYVMKGAFLVAFAACFLTFAGLCFALGGMHAPSLDSRVMLIYAILGTGLVLAGWAVRELRAINARVARA